MSEIEGMEYELRRGCWFRAFEREAVRFARRFLKPQGGKDEQQ